MNLLINNGFGVFQGFVFTLYLNPSPRFTLFYVLYIKCTQGATTFHKIGNKPCPFLYPPSSSPSQQIVYSK